MKLEEHFKGYNVNFEILEKDISKKTCENYYSQWAKKYTTFLSENTDEGNVIMACRCHRARKEIISSAQLWSESLVAREQGCLSAYFFLCYYSLFHAMLSVLYLNTDVDENIVNLTHSKLENLFCDYYAKGDDAIFEQNIREYIEQCRYYRETYSYNLPYNVMYSSFDADRLKTVILKCFQLSNMHAWLVNKKTKLIRPNVNNRDFIRVQFLLYNARKDVQGIYVCDDAEQNALSEALKYGVSCQPFELEIGHDWDEMGYNEYIESLFEEKAIDRVKGNALHFLYEAIEFC